MFYFSEMKLKRVLCCDIRWISCILCWTLFTTALSTSVDPTLKNSTLPTTSPLHCSTVRHALQNERGFGEIPREPISGEGLKVCNVAPREEDQGGTNTCCTVKMEAALAARSRQEFDQALQNALQGKLAAVLRARATKFDEFFRTMLATSKVEFHEMFKKTYGVIYEQNSYVFVELFDELERYYARGRVRLDHSMEVFFAKLYQKMFTVLNGQYHFDSKYLECVGHHMRELRPFGDVPHKLSVQVKRSFIATRTFGQALIVAADVAGRMQGVHPPPECGRALARMSGCNVCQGRPNLRACSGFCANVMRGCLAYHSDLDTEWNSFVDAFVKISDRLLGPFNIEVVVEPINIKISEAIMNFQENGHEVSQKVFSGCGRPRLGKRSNPATELHFETLRFGNNNNRNRGSMHSEPTPLEKLINDTSFKVKDTKNFWSLLPLQMCNNEEIAASPKQDNNCWNGQQKARYTQHLVSGAGILAQASNPEVRVSAVESSRTNSLLNEQMYALRVVTNKLRSAYNGKDVEWDDDDEDMEIEGSGSGSGDFSTPSSGEGRSGIHQDKGPEDLESGEGSGGYSYPEPPPRQRPHPAVPPSPTPPREHSPPPQQPVSPGGGTTSAAPPRHSQTGKLATTRAVVTYLFPIVVVWFGGMFTEW